MSTVTTVPVILNLYPRDRCKYLRHVCILQARQRRERGERSEVLRLLGHALYWSTRARTGLEPEKAQAIAFERGKRFDVPDPAIAKAATERASAAMVENAANRATAVGPSNSAAPALTVMPMTAVTGGVA